MLARKYLAQIHIEKNNAHLDDDTYRLILHDVAGVDSSKELEAKQVWQVVSAIRSRAPKHQGGWQQKQINKIRQYTLKFSQMDEVEMRQILFLVTGEMHEGSPNLKQSDFDQAMAEVESRLDKRIKAGLVKLPKGLSLSYWRDRKPGAGMITTREKKYIRDLWDDLQAYLAPEKCNDGYLFGIAAGACHGRINSLDCLKSWQALKLIEALKDKLDYESNRQAELDFEEQNAEPDPSIPF